MPSWKFSDQYGAQYPALQTSIFDRVVFSDHTLTGASFSGTVDVAATGAVMTTVGQLAGMTQIPVTGTVQEQGGTLAVALSTDQTPGQGLTPGVAASIPLVGGQVTKQAYLTLGTTVTTDPNGEPADVLDFYLVLNIGSAAVELSTVIPMNGGSVIVRAESPDAKVGLSDLSFLMGGAGVEQWWPGSQLGPYNPASQTDLALLYLSLTLELTLSPLSVSLVSVTAAVGLEDIPLMDQKLYLNPLGVWITVISPTSGPSFYWGLEGAIALCNYQTPGDLAQPDFVFDFEMGFTDFSISGRLENPSDKSINVMLQDLLGQGTDVGLSSDLTVDAFDFFAAASPGTGTVSDFEMDVALSGGFGLFQDFDIESFSISVQYSGG